MPSLIRDFRRKIAGLAVMSAAALVGCGEDEPGVDACVTGICGTTADGGQTTSNTDGGNLPGSGIGGLPCDVAEIVQAKCQKCHSDPPVGTFMPLVAQSHFQAPSTTDATRPYYQLAKERINDAANPMPPRLEPQLTETEKATLNAWFDQGAPASTQSCGGEFPGGSDGGVTNGGPGGGSDGGVPVVGSGDGGEPQIIGEDIDVSDLECYRFTAHENGNFDEKLKVGVATDVYYAMAFAAPWTGTVYGAVVRPLVDNAQVLHHWLLYQEPGNAVDGSVQLSGGWHASGALMAGYAPGGTAMDFRRKGDVGFELPDTNYTMEFHYNSADPDAVDGSGVEVCVLKEKPANVATMSWLGKDHAYQDGYLFTGVTAVPNPNPTCNNGAKVWTGTCNPGHTQPIQMMFLMPHMHEKGVHMKAVIVDEFGNELRVLHDEPFDFNYQVTYEITDPALQVLNPGERIVTTCTFTEPTCVGQATGAEMCYLYTFAYPAGALADNRSWGSLAHGANTCLGQDFPPSPFE